MTSLLLLLSFLLHLVLTIVIIRLFQHVQQLKHNQSEQLESLIAEFTEEIRVQNEKLERHLSSDTPNSRFQDSFNHALAQINEKQVEPTMNRIEEEMQAEQAPSVQRDNESPQLDAILNNNNNDYDDQIEMSLESKVMKLSSEGKSIAEIAKLLNRGKTEIELILKLHNREQKEVNT